MSALPLSASAQNRLLGAALLAVALACSLMFPLDGVPNWFAFGLGAGTGVLLTGKPILGKPISGKAIWSLKRWLSRPPLSQQ
ncbi:hypothetical protein GGP84_002965 [Salinibacter ruber]|nr:hypothetical protein [Salinibacter ruber]